MSPSAGLAAVAPERADRRIALGLFVVTLVAYAWFFGGGGWNQNAQFDLTRALVERRTVSIDAYKDNTYDVSFHGGHVYANKSPGISFLATIPYSVVFGVERLAGIDPGAPAVTTVNAWICTVAICGVTGALIPAVLYLYGIAGLGAGRGWAVAVALVVAFATPLFAYASVLFLHVPSAAFLLMAFAVASGSRGRRPWLAGALAGLAGLCNYLCIPAAAMILAMFWSYPDRNKRRVLAFLGGALPFAALLLAYQHAAFGSILRTPIDTESRVFLDENAFWGIIRVPSLEAAWGITFSRFRGLFYLSPVMLFFITGARSMWKRRYRAELLAISAVALFFVGFNTTFNGWDGGSAIGPRYILPIVPLLGVLMIAGRPLIRWLFATAAAVSFAMNFAAVAVNPIPSHTIKDPVGRYILPLLASGRLPADVPEYPPWAWKSMLGHVSVNRHTIDEFVPFVKHPPGSREAEWASFNVGEIVAPGSPASLIPILLWIACGAAALGALALREERERRYDAEGVSSSADSG